MILSSKEWMPCGRRSGSNLQECSITREEEQARNMIALNHEMPEKEALVILGIMGSEGAVGGV